MTIKMNADRSIPLEQFYFIIDKDKWLGHEYIFEAPEKVYFFDDAIAISAKNKTKTTVAYFVMMDRVREDIRHDG